ncbi:hypothetical protein KC357_g72 [Hortaea werneckii]|nr:hypothetical protein KC357_g72 [Hortaea werneckii]
MESGATRAEAEVVASSKSWQSLGRVLTRSREILIYCLPSLTKTAPNGYSMICMLAEAMVYLALRAWRALDRMLINPLMASAAFSMEWPWAS